MSLRRNGLSSPAEGASLARVLFPLTGRFDCCGLLVCLGELYAGEGKAQSPQKKRKTPDHAKRRSAPPRYSASCLKTSCMPNSRLPFWAGQTRQRCGAPGPGRPRTPLVRHSRAPAAGGGCRSRAAPRPARRGSRRRGLQRRERPALRAGGRGRKGGPREGGGSGVRALPELPAAPFALRAKSGRRDGARRGAVPVRSGCRAPGEWVGREPCAKGSPPAQGPRSRGSRHSRARRGHVKIISGPND